MSTVQGKADRDGQDYSYDNKEKNPGWKVLYRQRNETPVDRVADES